MTLLARYPLQEDAGTTAYDVAGTNDGSATGATPNVAGPLGGSAWSFDGTDDSIDVSAVPYSSLDEITFSALVYLPSDLTQPVFGGHRGSGDDWRMNANDIAFDDGTFYQITPNTWLTTGEWHHYLVTHSNPESTVAFYSNGKLRDSGTDTFNYGSVTGGILGRRAYTGYSTTPYLAGRLADVRFYDHAMSAAEASYLAETYRRGTVTLGTKSFPAAATPNLAADYALNGSTVTVDVVGSPETAAQEVQQVTLDGTTDFSLTWNSAHTDFRIAVSLGDATSIAEAAPTITQITLS